MAQIPIDDLKCPRQDFPLTWGSDLEFVVRVTDAAGQPWPFAEGATAHIRVGKDKQVALIDCVWHPTEQSAILVHLDKALLDTLKSKTEYQVLTATPVDAADPILDEPWLVGLLVREALA